MFEAVRKILAKQLRIDAGKITMESRIMEDLRADSVAILMLLMDISDEYGIAIPDEKLAAFRTVGDIVEYLEGEQIKL